MCLSAQIEPGQIEPGLISAVENIMKEKNHREKADRDDGLLDGVTQVARKNEEKTLAKGPDQPKAGEEISPGKRGVGIRPQQRFGRLGGFSTSQKQEKQQAGCQFRPHACPITRVADVRQAGRGFALACLPADW